VHAHVVASSGRSLLADVSAEFAPGELSAVMGPSGCGKSTLLAALRSGDASSGALLANGAPYSSLSMAVLVPQADMLLSELSALEMATFAAELRLRPGTSRAACAQVGADALRRLRLSEVDMRVRIGDANDARGGLSGAGKTASGEAAPWAVDPEGTRHTRWRR
jgi:ABC-type multidrug transport system ATPase subunit